MLQNEHQQNSQRLKQFLSSSMKKQKYYSFENSIENANRQK